MMNYELFCGNCLDILPTLQPGGIDAVIADPPYGTTACAWDSVIPFEPMWAGIRHVLKPRGAVVLFGSQPFTSALVMSNADWFKYQWVWRKNRATGFLDVSWRPLNNIEDIILFSDGIPVYNPQMKPGKRHKNGAPYLAKKVGVYSSFTDRQTTTTTNYYPHRIIEMPVEIKPIHPTQKPVILMEYLIKTYTNPGDMVLDFTMGSGSTGVAAMRTGRRFIGIEMKLEYYRIAEQRIKNAAGEFVLTDEERERGQLSLFEGWE